MNRIKNIIFDLGGVLLDLDIHRCLERLENIGLHEVRQWMTGTNEKGFFKEYECGTLTTEQFRDRICEEVGRELPDEEIDRIWNSMLKEIPDYKIRMTCTGKSVQVSLLIKVCRCLIALRRYFFRIGCIWQNPMWKSFRLC